MTLPGPEELHVVVAQVGQRCGGVLQRAVDDDVVLGEVGRERLAPTLGDHVAQVLTVGLVVELSDPHRVDRRAHGCHLTVGEDRDLVHAMGVEGGHRPAGRGTEADHDRGQALAVVAGDARDLHRLDHRAVARELVVLVEDVEADRAVAGPVVHRLEGDQRELLVDGHLGELRVLHAVGPAPQDLPGTEGGDVGVLRLGQQHHVRLGQELGARGEPGDVRRERAVGGAEALAVPVLEPDLRPEVGVQQRDVLRVQRQPELVLLG